MTQLTPIKLFKGDALDQLAESFSGFTDLPVFSPAPQVELIIGAGSISAAGVIPVQHGGLGALLDYSVPTLPTVLADGVYALTANMDGQDTASFMLGLTLGPYTSALESVNAIAGQAGAFVTITAVAVLAAGDGLSFYVQNGSGAGLFNVGQAPLVKLY